MTVTELKGILSTVASVMDAGVEYYPLELSHRISYFLKSLSGSNLDALALLTKMEAAELANGVAGILKVLGVLDELFGEGGAKDIASFARNLMNRPVAMQLLTWNLR